MIKNLQNLRNLLIAFLLAVFAFQGAFVAVGTDGAAAMETQQLVVAPGSPDHLDDEADELNASAAVEELSDYLPVVSSMARAEYPVPARRLPGVVFLSIHLPAIEPPPRA